MKDQMFIYNIQSKKFDLISTKLTISPLKKVSMIYSNILMSKQKVEEQQPKIDKVLAGDMIQLKNNKYRVERCSARIADFFFHKTPMLFLVYEALKDRAREILHDN